MYLTDSDFTIQYDISLVKIISEIEKYNKKNFNGRANTSTN